MNTEELREEWESGDETGMRPARVQEVRSDLMDATGLPIPRRRVAIEGWLETMKPQVTRALREATGEYDEQHTNDDDSAEADEEK